MFFHKFKHIKTEIDKTDTEIDKMVYVLYDLTEEEIGIVEGWFLQKVTFSTIFITFLIFRLKPIGEK
ncbi:MAG TPA: hypothetical protein PLP27_00010 [Crocinitomicaceae bacterium]|nr:hypothetical protein [Crocinitomicaceae bacterium]